MKRSVYLAAATIAALTACKQNVVVENNAVATAAGTTADLAINETGVDSNVTSSGTIDTNTVNGTAIEEEAAGDTANNSY
jgi:hypothetical protein